MCCHYFGPWTSSGGKRVKRAFPPWDWNKAPRLSRKYEVSSSIPINWLDFCNVTVFSDFRYDTDIAQQPSSLFWCHAVVSLQFTRVHSFAWPNLGANSFCCWCLLRNNITAANFQRFASSYDRKCFNACWLWTLVPRIVISSLA